MVNLDLRILNNQLQAGETLQAATATVANIGTASEKR